MSFFDDPGKSMRALERQLKEAEPQPPPEEGAEDYADTAPDFSRMYYADETLGDSQAYFEEDYRADRRARRQKPKKKSGCGPALLGILELLVIAALLGVWILWKSKSL